MNSLEENVYKMAEHTRLTHEKYEEPTDGHFPDATQTILKLLKSPTDDEDVRDTDQDEKQG